MKFRTTISWFRNKDLLYYIEKLSEHFGGSRSMAVIECVMCHQQLSDLNIDWRTIDNQPDIDIDLLAEKIVEKLKKSGISFNGKEEVAKEEIRSLKPKISKNLFG